jgi:hypothetical protein
MPNPALYWIVIAFLIIVGVVAFGSILSGITYGAIIIVMIGAIIVLAYMGLIPGMPRIVVYLLIIAFLVIIALFAPQTLSEIAKILGIIPK